jgi:uncharacterized protein
MGTPPMSTPAMQSAPARPIHFVLKTSKYCNLRCTYCYEFAFLDDRRRMSLEQIEFMFGTIGDFAKASDIDTVGFTWHGGEPFLVPIKVYKEIGVLQHRLLANVTVTNNVQTNLTILTDHHLEFMKSGDFFSSIGISFDVSGNRRVDKQGRATTPTVLNHMQRLFDADISFGTICVLGRDNFQHAPNLFKFFDDLNTQCRFLPFYRNTDCTGDHSEALSQQEIVGALIAIFDAWMQSENVIGVEPLGSLVDIATKSIQGGPFEIYDKRDQEWTYVVNPNGDLWGISEIEDNRYLYGNIFRAPLDDILSSDARQSTFAQASRQIDRICGNCPYLGHCSAYFVADATDGILATLEREGCHIRGVLDHIVERLQDAGLADEIRRKRRGSDMGAPAVGPGGAPLG